MAVESHNPNVHKSKNVRPSFRNANMFRSVVRARLLLGAPGLTTRSKNARRNTAIPQTIKLFLFARSISRSWAQFQGARLVFRSPFG